MQVTRCMNTALMFILFFSYSLTADEPATVTTACQRVPQKKATVNGKPVESTIDLLVADIPDKIAVEVEKESGINAKGDGVSLIASDQSDGTWITNVSGDGFSAKGSGEIPALGIKPWKHDFYVRYVSLVESISKDKIYTYGYLEYHDRINKKRCYVFCELRGEVNRVPGRVPELSGSARWIGPVQNAKLPKPAPLPPSDDSE